jgi:hypothetical protein
MYIPHTLRIISGYGSSPQFAEEVASQNWDSKDPLESCKYHQKLEMKMSWRTRRNGKHAQALPLHGGIVHEMP